MTAQNWTLACVAETQLYAVSGNASLEGNFGGKVWKFEYSVNGTDWFDVASLVSSSENHSIGGPEYVIHDQPSLPTMKFARYLKVSYDANLTADPTSSTVAAGGYGTIEATAPKAASPKGNKRCLSPLKIVP